MINLTDLAKELDAAIALSVDRCGHPSMPKPVETEIHRRYFTACGLIGLPVPPVMMSGGPAKKNS